jgi:hypothetical protein
METVRTQQLAQKNYWEELLKMRDEQRVQLKGALQVVRGDELPQEVNAQGLMRWYLHPAIKDTVLQTFIFFEQEIPPGSRTGRMRFQGGQVIIILEGSGYTMLDGVKHSWSKDDVLNLPIRGPGIVVQHFNTDPKNLAKFVAVEPNWFACTTVDRGSGFEQLEDAPEYQKAKRSR